MKLLFIGDIYGRSGRDAVAKHLPNLKESLQPDITVINGENAAHGRGITIKQCEALFDMGVDCITTGNHAWGQREIIPYFDREKRLIRPDNYPAGAYGNGSYELQLPDGRKALIVNVMCRVFMDSIDCPFQAIDKILNAARLGQNYAAIFVDLHGEASSEKMAFGHYVDGRVSGVIGTHTHIPTADNHVMVDGTAYMSDAGMTGDYDSVIGAKKHIPVHRFTKKTPCAHMEPADGEATMCGAVIDIDDNTGLARSIQRLRIGGVLSQEIPD